MHKPKDYPEVAPMDRNEQAKPNPRFEDVKETGDEEEEEYKEVPQSNVTRPIIEYDPDAKITVSDPAKTTGGISKHTEYKVKGADSQGEFDISRRYKEFYNLRALLSKNWPGFYIPSIPTKVTIGNMEDGVVQER